MSIREDIYNYDIKLAELKKELNELTKTYLSDPSSNSKFLTSKINSMQQEIEAINYQLNLLKQVLPNEAVYNTIVQEKSYENIQTNDQYLDLSNTPIQKQVFEEHIKSVQDNYSNYKETSSNNKDAKDLENTIGKSFMGILASILIFISFVLFAIHIYPLISDGLKIFAMYAISLGFLLFGYQKLKKKPDNKLYLSITGCGIGALYLSLIISNVYFKIIGDITLYLLILAWAIFTAYLSRLRSNIFGIIGQLGISIALIFGCNTCEISTDINKFFILILFFIITTFLFKTSKIYSENFANNLFGIINLSIMTNSYFIFTDKSNIENVFLLNTIPYILCAFVIFKMFIAYTKFKYVDDSDISFSIFNNIYIFIMLSIMDSMIPSTFNFNIIILIIATIFLIINEFKFKELPESVGRILFQIIMIVYLVFACFNISLINDYIGLSLLAIPFIIYGFYKNDKLFKIAGLVSLGIYIFQSDLYSTLHFIIGLFTFILIAYLTLKNKENYTTDIKIFTYILLLLFGSFHINNLLESDSEVALFIFLSITNIIAAKSAFVKNYLTNEIDENFASLTMFINAILMAWSLNLISNSTDFSVIIQTLVILVALALFFANTRNLLKKYEGHGAGIYISIKFTILMLVILNAWQASNIVISICLLLFAILMIVLGFIFKQKSFRLYGLGLAMISTVKLIMIDINYDDSIGNALSFFLSGILCFGISAIYNLIDKKFLK